MMYIEHTVDRLRKADGLFRAKGGGFREIRRNRRHNKHFTRFGVAFAGPGTPYATNGDYASRIVRNMHAMNYNIIITFDSTSDPPTTTVIP